MIPSRKSPWLVWWFGRHVERRLRRTFEAVYVLGLEDVQRINRAKPLLVVSNHTSWWDPMFCIWLSARGSPLDGYALMTTASLRERPFLGRLGGFGVDLSEPADGARAIRYAARLLSKPRRIVWVFPQGAERPSHEALAFQPGAGLIARAARLDGVVPAGIRYVFGAQEKPRMFVSFGPALAVCQDASTFAHQQAQAVQAELDRIDAVVSRGIETGEFEATTVLTSPRSRFDRLAERLLAAMTRY